MIRKASSRRRAGLVIRRPSSARRSKAVLDVTVVLLNGGYPSTAIAPIEVFHSAGLLWNQLRGDAVEPRFRVRTASIDGKSVTSLCSLGLKPEFAIHDIDDTDIIIVPACGTDVSDRLAKGAALLPWLREWHSRGAYIAGICSGVAFLAECGLLDGRQATTHWGMGDTLKQRYPNVDWRPEQFVTEDGRVLCGGGVYASADLSLYLVEKFCGHDIALQCAKALLLSMPRSRQSGYAAVPLSHPHSDDRIRQSEEFLQAHFSGDMSIDLLADRISMGPRNFIRRFKAATGQLPGAYIQALRVSAAREMLERGDESIQTICSRIGYEDIAFFRSLFKRHTGMTPAEYRKRFARMSFDQGELAGGAPVRAVK